jgi:sarcosine oxidase
MADHYDVIVVGVGGMGSTACWQLTRRGQRVLGLERFGVPHRFGSSHGVTRVIRLAYYESPAYVPLLRRAYALWHDTETALGETLLITTGSLDAGPEGSARVNASLRTCVDHDLAHQILTGTEVNARFPGHRLPEDFRAVFQPDGGIVLSERAIVGHVTMAQAAGAEIRAHEEVQEWSPLAGGGVRVVTDRGQYDAGRLVLTAGAWIGDLLPAAQPFAVPERQVVGWFQPLQPSNFLPETFPVTLLFVEEGFYYALPIYGVPGVKIGRYHHRDETGHADALSREPEAEDEALLRRGLSRYLSGADGPVMSLQTCMFTNTPDEHFIIDRLPEHPDVIVASPCSGHGYKFASVIGEIVADLATDKQSAFDLTMFRLSRFTET